MNIISPDCSLCNALSVEGQKSKCNKILYETINFALIPSIGPLTLGHAIIVSKYHFESLAQMGKEDIIECGIFLDQLVRNKEIKEDFLIFEHGSYDNQQGGNCVAHTHIHIMPKFGAYYNLLDNVLNVVPLNLFNELGNVDFPYILSFNNTDFRVYEGYNVHSQMMRKAICAKLNIIEWDWRKNSNDHLINLSIEYWNNKSKNEG